MGYLRIRHIVNRKDDRKVRAIDFDVLPPTLTLYDHKLIRGKEYKTI